MQHVALPYCVLHQGSPLTLNKLTAQLNTQKINVTLFLLTEHSTMHGMCCAALWCVGALLAIVTGHWGGIQNECHVSTT